MREPFFLFTVVRNEGGSCCWSSSENRINSMRSSRASGVCSSDATSSSIGRYLAPVWHTVVSLFLFLQLFCIVVIYFRISLSKNYNSNRSNLFGAIVKNCAPSKTIMSTDTPTLISFYSCLFFMFALLLYQYQVLYRYVQCWFLLIVDDA